MSQRTFIVAMACLLLAAAGFVSWVILSSEKNPSVPQVTSPTPKREYTRRKVASKTVHPNRYEGITGNSVRWQVRVDQLRRMDASTLNKTEVDYLYAQLRHQPSGQKEAWWVVMNEIMEQIVKQGIAPERISPEFCSLISDSTLDPVVRDYAIQHISVHLASLGPPSPSMAASSPTAPSTTSENGKQNTEHALKTLVSAIKAPENQHNSIPGTAFMGLIEASSNPNHQEEVNKAFSELENYIMPLIKGEASASLANRTSAINAVGLIQSPQYLPVLRELITTEQINDSVKLSSIAALGDFHAPPGPPSPSLASQPQVSSSTVSSTKSENGTLNTENSSDSAIDRQILEGLAASNTKFKHAAIAALNKFQN